MSAEPPTERELDLAFTWIILNSIRLFFRVQPDDVNEGEERFLKIWRAIPAERRQTALDFVQPVPDPEETERERAIEAMRRRVV